jgi:cytochrome bd-type quinol oxidase subunit 2
MKKLENYVESIVSDLPLSDSEKQETRLELLAHLEEHVYELISFGWRKEEAICFAIKSFGNETEINREMKKAVFPLYKLIRLLWSATLMTAGLAYFSYAAMEYYFPQFDNIQPYSYYMGIFLVFMLIAAILEAVYEGINKEIKSRWLANPWLFSLLPLIIASLASLHNWQEQPQRYEGPFLLDLFSVHFAGFLYLISRELFTFLFVPSILRRREKIK